MWTSLFADKSSAVSNMDFTFSIYAQFASIFKFIAFQLIQSLPYYSIHQSTRQQKEPKIENPLRTDAWRFIERLVLLREGFAS